MAKSANFHGLRRGSTKSHTYSVVDGKQITKDRVEGGKNPRSSAQMAQRCIITTVSAAYSAMKCICNHSFEEATAGMQSMRVFNSKNYKKIRLAQESGDSSFGFCLYQQSGLVAGSYIISAGSLPDSCPNAVVSSVDTANGKVSLQLALGSTIADIAEPLGCRLFGDMCTVVVIYPKTDGNYGFAAVRFTYHSGTTVVDSFTVGVTGDAVEASTSFESNTFKVEIRMAHPLASGASTSNTYMTAIASRYVNGKWLRSNAKFTVTDAMPTFAQAIVTYPVGQERFLNGGAAYSTANAKGYNGTPSDDSGSTTGGNTSTGSGTNTGGNTTGGNTGGGNTDPDSGDGGE